MSSYQTDEEVLASHVGVMGTELGFFFHRLRNHTIFLHFRWHEYVELYGKSQAEFDVMNAAAPRFFNSVQEIWWQSILLGICRLADNERVAGKRTLSLKSLAKVATIRQVVRIDELIDAALTKAKFAKEWRNRSIAHTDLQHELDRTAAPLPPASRNHVREALSGIADVVNAIELHFKESSTYWGDSQSGDGEYLLRQLKIYKRLEDERRQRLTTGQTTTDDQDWDKWHGKF